MLLLLLLALNEILCIKQFVATTICYNLREGLCIEITRADLGV